MGHAGAIISVGSGKAEDKIAALKAAGTIGLRDPAGIGEKVKIRRWGTDPRTA